MLQRIQTVYFLLAITCVALLYSFTAATISTLEHKLYVKATGLFASGESIGHSLILGYMVCIPLVLVVLVITLASFKKRGRQLKLTMLSMLLTLILIAYSVFLIGDVQESNVNSVTEYGVGFYLPIASACFIFLAMRGVRRDIKLLKSLDRLR